MLKNFMTQERKDRWRERAASTWRKLSRGAAEISRLQTWGSGDQWRRKDKHQAHHNPPGHKVHRDR